MKKNALKKKENKEGEIGIAPMTEVVVGVIHVVVRVVVVAVGVVEIPGLGQEAVTTAEDDLVHLHGEKCPRSLPLVEDVDPDHMIVIGTEFGLVIVNGLVVGIEKDPVEILLVSIPVQKNRENLVLPMNLLPLHHHRDWSDLRRAHRPAQVQARIAPHIRPTPIGKFL